MSLRSIILPFLFVLINAFCSFAQDARLISGTIKDEYGQPVSKANILAYFTGKVTANAFAVSDANGTFSVRLNNIPATATRLLLKVTKLNYRDTFTTVSMARGVQEQAAISISIHSHTGSLPQVTVRALLPVIEKGDTTIFNVSRFDPESERKTEDLLKKLPGIAIDENGRITFKNKVVSKVLIEGDDLFGYNYTMLTQNLDAAALSQVEVVENAADNPVLKNFDFNRQTVLNLKVKKKYLYRLFGDISAAGNMQDNFDGTSNLFALMNRYKLSVMSGTNNTGRNSTARTLMQNQKWQQYVSDENYTPQAKSSYTPLPIRPLKAPGISFKRFNENEDGYVQANLIIRKFKKLEIKSSIGIAGTNDRVLQMRNTSFSNAPASLSLSELLLYREHGKVISGSFNARYANAELSRLELSFNAAGQTTDGRSNLAGTKTLAQAQNLSSTSVNAKVKYSLKTGKNSALNIDGLWQSTQTPLSYIADTIVKKPESNDHYLGFRYNNPVQFTGLSLGYFNKQKNAAGTEREINLFAGFSETIEQTRSFLSGMGLPDYGIAPFMNNEYRYTFHTQRYWLAARGSVKTKDFTFIFTPKAEYAAYRIQNKKSGQSEPAIMRLLPQPSLMIRKRSGKNRNLQAGYFYRQSLPDIIEMQNGAVLLDYRTIFRYNALNYLNTQHNVSFQYCNANIGKGRTFLSGITYSWQRNGYQYNYLNFPGYNEQFKELSNQPLKMANFFLSEDLTLPSITTFLSMKYSGSYSTFSSTINSTTAKQHNLFSSAEVSARTAFKSPVNVTGGFMILYNKQFSNTGNRSTGNYKWQAGIRYASQDKKFLVKLNYDEYRFINLSPTRFIDATAEYRILKNKLTLNFTLNNLLNEQEATSVILFPDQKTEITYPVLPRMILLGVNFKF